MFIFMSNFYGILPKNPRFNEISRNLQVGYTVVSANKGAIGLEMVSFSICATTTVKERNEFRM